MTYGERRHRTRGRGSKVGPAVVENRPKIQKKMLNRRNEAKDLVKRKDLALLRAQNELVLSAKKPYQSEKYDHKPVICEASSEPRNSKCEIRGQGCQLLGFGFLLSSFASRAAGKSKVSVGDSRKFTRQLTAGDSFGV